MHKQIILNIKVKPNAPKTEIVQRDQNYWKVNISAPPVKGLANKELIKLLADEFGVARSNIAIIKGFKSREKIVKIIK